jgi:hypothetical protein
MTSTATTPDLSSLTVDDLKALKRQWYQDAIADGTIAAIGRVVRELGECHPKKHGANWVWESDDVKIVLDDWTGHVVAIVGDRQVFAQSTTSRLFVPGRWTEAVELADIVARNKIAARRGAAVDGEHAALLRELGGAFR